MKRIGFIGLSTPSFYDYSNPASRGPADSSTSPNPIIEGAFGAMLLYDELWFLSRSLCPENMRGLTYVKFLDEGATLPDVDPEWLLPEENVFSSEALQVFTDSSALYSKVKGQAHVHWNAAADNHTHALNIGKYTLTGNSWSVKSVLYDICVLGRLPQGVELVANSFTAALFDRESSTHGRALITESLILDSVPQFLSPKGPYNSCIEEVRESSYLSYYRKWISTEAFKAGSNEIEEMKREVEAKLSESQTNVFLKYLSPEGSYVSLAKTVFGLGVDALIPGVASINDLVEQRSEEKVKQAMRWQGFLIDAREKVRGASKRH